MIKGQYNQEAYDSSIPGASGVGGATFYAIY